MTLRPTPRWTRWWRPWWSALHKGNYFGTMLVKMGVADCLLGGATYSTADTVRPALQLI